MATNADFNSLIARITTATNTLETDVVAINAGASNITEQVEAAEQAASQAQASQASATASASTATTQANAASSAATTATNEANRTQAIADDLLASAPFQEAPEDSQTYGRNNGDWVVVTGGGGGGAVGSVNGQTGTVVLTAADVGAKPSSYVPTWSEVTGKPATFPPTVGTTAATALAGNTVIPTNTNQLTNGAGFVTATTAPVRSVAGKTGVVTLAAADIASGVMATARLGTGTASSTTVLKGDGTWGSVPAPTGGYIIPSVGYNGANVTQWPFANPNMAAQLSLFGEYVAGEWVEGAALLNTQSGVNALPVGNYWFPAGTFTGTAFAAQPGNVEIRKLDATNQTAVITTFTNPVNEYIWTISGSTVTWRSVGAAAAPATGWPVASFKYKGTNITTWPLTNPFESLWIGDCANTAGTVTGVALFASTSAMNALPAGKYCFRSADFASGPLSGNLGFIHVDYGEVAPGNFQRRAWAYIQSTGTVGNMYVMKSDGNWNPV